MNNMKYYVYYTYKIDEPNKAYVGMSIKCIETGYVGSGTLLSIDINKYGVQKFKRIDLGEFSDKHECNYWESFYIKVFKTLKKYGGYNTCKTGGHYHNTTPEQYTHIGNWEKMLKRKTVKKC